MTTWLQHVKKTHAAGSTSFKESLKRASASWKKGGAAGDAKAAPKKRRRKKKAAAEEKTSTEEPAPAKKKRRKAKRSMPKIPVGAFKSVDSKSL